jgi:hypothetical protein
METMIKFFKKHSVLEPVPSSVEGTVACFKQGFS